jgi:oxygen-independent coproporphyrinogen-3 oxidase
VSSLVKEIHLRKDYLPEKNISTIYFGGGTPSLLRAKDFERIFNAIYQNYSVDSAAEITFEANPDDLTQEYFTSLSSIPFNRISIGIQSFNDYYLGLLNRRHSRKQAMLSIENAQKAGFRNISIDLMYGLPYQTLSDWEEELKTALQMDIQHISAYGLTYEEGTMLWKMLDDGRIEAVSDETMNEMYRMLLKKTQESGFEAYEISNFSLPDFRSRHNSVYWKQKPYIGIGASAHSYNGESRQWNINSIGEYIRAMAKNEIPSEQENLSFYDRYNDFVMVSLRTAEGINLAELEIKFGSELKKYCLENMKTFIETGKIEFSDNVIRLNTDGILISNTILAEMMKV